jgi:hypothetical protein
VAGQEQDQLLVFHRSGCAGRKGNKTQQRPGIA